MTAPVPKTREEYLAGRGPKGYCAATETGADGRGRPPGRGRLLHRQRTRVHAGRSAVGIRPSWNDGGRSPRGDTVTRDPYYQGPDNPQGPPDWFIVCCFVVAALVVIACTAGALVWTQ